MPESHGCNFKVEKRPGPDWVVELLLVEENEVYPVTIFGVQSADEAVADAIASFANEPLELRVVSVTRNDDVGQ
jgi:hypothetical protein